MNNIQAMLDKIGWLFTREAIVLSVILANALALFLDAFPLVHETAGPILHWIDYGCLIYFIVEVLAKSKSLRDFSSYWVQGWNRLDFIVVAISLPVLISPFVQPEFDDLALILLFRLGRLLRFTRVLKYVPNATRILKGVGRALKASVGVVLVLLIVNVIFGLGATLLFGDVPEARAYFGDPFRSMYSMFKVFTIEGWYEIPDQMERLGVSGQYLLGMRAYFTVAVLVGGLVGLSIANAVFVDEMMADNTEAVETNVRGLHEEFRQFREEYRQDRSAYERNEGAP